MKTDIHPKYYPESMVTCACGNTFTVGSTLPEIQTELCSKCHPFFTGTQKLIDTARRVDKYQRRLEKGVEAAKQRKGKKTKTITRKAKKNIKATDTVKQKE